MESELTLLTLLEQEDEEEESQPKPARDPSPRGTARFVDAQIDEARQRRRRILPAGKLLGSLRGVMRGRGS